jgi:putative membrane protein
MMLEAALAYVHLAAILSWVVFVSSTAALARIEWLNPAVVNRLVVVDRIAFMAGGAVLASGLARWWLGSKGVAWYAHQPLLWAKLVLFVVMAVAALRTRRDLREWQRRLRVAGELPDADAVAALRLRVMRASHLVLVLPVAAVLLARGIWTV